MALRERLIEFIKYNNLTTRSFEEIVGLSNAAVSKMGDNTRRTTIDKISNKFPELNTNWLLTGQGNMIINGNTTMDNRTIETRPRIPLDAAAGSLSIIERSVTESECEYLPVIPRLPHYDFTIFARGDSMEPEFQSGDELACRFINERGFIQWGRPHVLDTAQGIVVKRIFEDTDNIICCSDNSKYRDFTIPKEDIYRIALVVGLVRSY